MGHVASMIESFQKSEGAVARCRGGFVVRANILQLDFVMSWGKTKHFPLKTSDFQGLYEIAGVKSSSRAWCLVMSR